MDWIPIGEMTAPPLSFMAQKLLHYAQIHKMGLRGREVRIARLALRIGENTMQEALYEIRKRENIIMGKLSNAQKAAIYQAYKDGAKQQELADQYGVCNQAISYTIKRMREAEKSMAAAVELPAAAQLPAPEPEKKPASVINPEFDAAVDQMIAEMHDAKAEKNAANAEEKSVIAEVPEPVPDPEPDLEDCENGIPNTPLIPAETEPLPPVVRRAVDGHLEYIAERIEALQYRISEIELEIEEYRKDEQKLKVWKEQQKWR